jgi:hypothetical protein
MARDAKLFTLIENKRGILTTLRPESVINVTRLKVQTEQSPNFEESEEQRHGILSAGESYKDSLSTRNALTENSCYRLSSTCHWRGL